MARRASPLDSSHIFYNESPSFRIFDASGTPQDPTAGGSVYASVNPVLPEVHDHINDVVLDIATNYNVDGVHLDLIRWLGGLSHSELPHDAISHQLFHTATGLDAAVPSNAAAYRNYITGRVTDLVGSIRGTVSNAESSTGRDIDLSAAVSRDPDIARNERLQDYRTWLQEDLLDIAMPMIYLSSSNDQLFLPNLQNTLNIATSARIAPGLGVYLHDGDGGGVDLTITQLQRLADNQTDGATFFSYNSFFAAGSLGNERRAAVMQFYDDLGDPGGGEVQVLNDFEVDEGFFGWPPTFSGSNIGIESATAERTSDEAYQGAFSQVLDINGIESGEWLLRHLSGAAGSTGNAGNPAANTDITSEGFVGFWLMTETQGVDVAIVVDDPSTGERGFRQPVIADGEWHLYEWNLDDAGQWEGWVTGNGSIDDPTTTIDSIQFFGTGDALIYLDYIAHNPSGSLAWMLSAADFDGDGDVDGDDFLTWQTGFGTTANASRTDGDADGDGDVDGNDFLIWQSQFGTQTGQAAAAIPEPATSIVAALAVLLASLLRCSRVTP